jgi:hypothetical protein
MKKFYLLIFFSIYSFTLFSQLDPGMIGTDHKVCYDTGHQTLTSLASPRNYNQIKWFYQVEGDNTLYPIASSINRTTLEYSISNINITSTTTFYRGVTNDYSTWELSNEVIVTCYSGFNGGSVAANQTVCSGATPNQLTHVVSPFTDGTFYTYLWQSRKDGIKDYSDITSATLAHYQPGSLTFKTFYRRIARTICGDFYSNIITIDIYSATVAGTIGSNQTICHNTSPSPLTNSTFPSGGNGSFSYKWEYSLNGTSGWTEISGETSSSFSPPALTVDTWYRRKEIGNCETVYSNVIKITVSQPFSVGSISADQTICSGSTPVRLESVADGSGGKGTAYYTWYISTNGTSYAAISPSARDKYYQPPALSVDTWYKRRFFNDCGNDYSNAIKISMASSLNGGLIGSNAEICYNTSPGTLTNETAASGSLGTITYSWEHSTDGTSFSAISGATGATYTVPNLTTTTHYKRKATSNCGFAFSNTITITVANQEVAGVVGSNQTICKDSSPASFTSSSTPNGGIGSWSYKWQYSYSGTGDWNDLTGQTGTTYSSGSLSSNHYFRRLEINSCKTISSNVISVSVTNNLDGGQIASNQNICYNSAPATFTNETSPSGGKGTWSYSWKKASSPSGTYTAISGTNSLTYTSGALIENTYFLRTSTNDCGSINSNYVSVTIASPLVAGSIGGEQSICYNIVPSSLSNIAAASGGSGTITYKWYVSSNGSTGWTFIDGATNPTYSPPALTSEKYYKRIAYDACTNAESNIVHVSVYPQMVAGTIGNNQIKCYNTVPEQINSITLPSGGNGSYSYQWQFSLTGTGNWNNINNENAANYAPSGALTAKTFYQRAETNQCGTIYSNKVTIDVLPDVVNGTIETAQSICNNTVPNAITNLTNPSGGTGTFGFSWEFSLNGTDNWTSILNENGTSFSPPALTSTRYFRRVEANTCKTVYTPSIKITVANPVSFGEIQGEQSICYNSIPSPLTSMVLPSGGLGSWNYTWSKSTDGISWSNISGANSASYQPVSLSETTLYKRIESNTCGSNETPAITVDVAKACVSGEIGTNQVICYNATPNPITNLTYPTGGLNDWEYKWEKSTTGTGNWIEINGETSEFISPSAMTSTLFFRRVEINDCGTVYSNIIQIEVLPDVTNGSIEADHSICYNTIPNALNSTSLPSGGTGTFVYTWQSSDNGIDFWNDISETNVDSYTPNALSSSKHFRRKAFNTCKTVYSNSVKVTVANPTNHGVISNNQSICYNTTPNALTNVALPSGGLNGWSYQWQQSSDNENWSNILGYNAENYSPGNLTASTYFRRLEDNDCQITASNSVLVTVASEITAGSIGADQLVCSNYLPNQIVSLTYPSGGVGGFSYKWEVSPNGTGGWTTIANETSETLNPSASSSLRYIRRVETNHCGVVNTNNVVLSIKGSYTPGVVGYSQTLCYGVVPQMISEISPAAGGEGGYEFQWQKSENGTDWFDLANQTGSVFFPPSNGVKTFYRRKLTEVCGSVYSNEITIDIKPLLIGGDIAYDQDLCPGETPSKIISLNPALGGMEGYNYQWQRSTTGDSGDWFTINGAIEDELTPSAFSSGQRLYRRMVTNNCGVAYSNFVTIAINSLMQPGEIGSDQTVCMNATPNPIVSLVDPSGWEGEFTYTWKYSSNGTDNWTSIPDQQSEDITLGAQSATRYFRRDISYRCGSVYSNPVKITVNNPFNPGQIGINQNIVCYGQQPLTIESSLLPSGGNGEYSYKWYKKNNEGQFLEILGATLSSYQPPILYESTTFVREDIDLCGTVRTNEITILVSGEFFAGRIGENQSILYGETPNLLEGLDEPTGGEGGYSYQWRTSPDSVTWNNVVGATDEHYQPSTLFLTTYFRRKTINQYCGEIVTNAVKITVSPDLLPGTLNGDQQICFNDNPSPIVEQTSPSGGNGDYSYQFQISPDGSSWEDILNATNSTFQPDRLTATRHFRRKVVNGSLIRYTPSLKITVNPFVPSPLTNEDALYCRGSLVRVDVTNPQSKAFWYNEDMEKVHEGNIFYVENLQEDATYFVFNLDEFNCFSDSSEVELLTDKVNASFTFDQANHINEGQKINFVSTSFGAVQWLWDFDMGETYTTANPTIYYNFSGTFDVYLKVWSALGCFDDVLEPELISVFPATDLQTSEKNSVSIYPNPFSSTLFVSGERIVRIEVYNALGSLVLSTIADSNLVAIDASNFSKGIFLIKVYSKNEISTLKVIKE